ncbi:hypothetical protein CI109_107036 [Kwoniella shandongensis]|uniref:Uncharacterized protein n=1 Tax=Kwoniella shandongensis TaxID=1734106 RepID=A0A5M6BUC4_9TREE|nr:uncharacterized protein CI109_006444 [Kwoniella shandongensis]KAA5525175.1 hypothetical protein CI109_006444 [Kwoniella shandongensis]
MSTTTNSPSSRLRLGPHQSPISATTAARNSIISSSAKGWSPLQINKRDSLTSPLKPSSQIGSTSPNPNEPRRSSSSFKHVTKNSLVSNSPFKSPTTPQGAQAAGLSLEKEVTMIHERRTTTTRSLGETPPTAKGVESTAKAAIGLGISAVKPRSTSRSASGSGSKSAVAGQRKASTEKVKVAFPERKPSMERRVSASKENESPDVRASKRVPRSSMGLKGLATGSLVTKSPFKRVPSGGLSATASTRANESPSDEAGPSPRSIPVEKDDVFSSPSPRRLSGGKQQQRRASPSSNLSAARTSDSPTPSPPRSVAQPLLVPGMSARPSPLSRPASVGSFDPTPTPTPHKSAMTPSRRLRGPRDLSAGPESPTRKTVTFQSVPDVKEFETMSAEPSADGSFDVGHDDEGDWAEDGLQGDDSLDEILTGDGYDTHTLRVINGDLQQAPSPVMTEENDGTMGDESTTAAFMDTLIQEGLFSPPTMDTPAFEDQADFELPLESNENEIDSDRPFLSTPSLGGSVHISPLFSSSEMFGETDNAGIPYGRTHHAERAALAHSLPPMVEVSPLEQPDLPHNEEHQMLLNANAAQPALPQEKSRPSSFYDYNDPWASSSAATITPAPHAHQAGPIPDPFITIQTATKVLPVQTRETERDEGGVPLGRTSHIERLQAARMLATQSLGLGMPRSPAISKELTKEAQRVDVDDSSSEEETGGHRGDPGEMLFDASFELGERVAPASVTEEKRRLPKVPAPAPAQIDVPSPVTSPVKTEEEKEQAAEKRSSKFNLGLGTFALPIIGSTSPFFNNNPATFEDQPPVEQPIVEETQPSVDGHSIRESSPETDRPLTPPPAIRDPVQNEDKNQSPHRLPDFNFNFEEIKFQAVETAPVTPALVKNDSVNSVSVPLEKSVETVPLKTEDSKMTTSTSGASLRSDFGGNGGPSKDSTTTRVRQRISREMIRETIQQRIADGSLSRRPSNLDSVNTASERPTSIIEKDKDLPTPPAETPDLGQSSTVDQSLAPRMTKAHTTDAAPRQVSAANRPAMRPRSQTQSAHDVLKQNERDGVIEEPKSALDKLTMGMQLKREVSGSIAAEMPPPPVISKDAESRPVSILRNPYPNPNANKQEGLLPPVKLENARTASGMSARSASPTGEGMKAREQAIIAKRREKEGRKVSAMSNGSRRSRRSLSMGDADQEVEQVKTFRHSVMGGPRPRLTLGIDDNERSILDQFREEMTNIGSDRGYKIREKPTVRASYHEKIGHNKAGDIDSGKAWKSLRRPSDLHEHAAEIRAMRSREAESGKASGTIFVKVLGIESLQVPVPDQQTFFCITLDNGIDYIRTPYSVLVDGAKVNQEFSLVEHPNFEFSLSLDIRRDPHILKLLHEKANPGSVGRPITPASSAKPHHGFRSLFSSPRKVKPGRDSRSSTPLPPSAGPSTASDTIVNYLAQPGGSTIAKTHVAFKPIANNCEARVLEIRYPMFAMFKGEQDRRSTDASGRPASSAASASTTSTGGQARKQLAKITLQVFRLPPIPGLKPDEMPQCIDECLRGMRHHAWHEHEYHEGVLTQEGGDCTHPKRRLFKLIGGNLVAINEVTKKEVTKIDLRKATAVIDLNADQTSNNSPKSKMTMSLRPRGSDEGFAVRPRSFEVVFGDEESGEGIRFMADSDAAKESWMTTLEGLIGKIPSNPLWAELLATRQRERAARRSASSSSLAKEAKRQASGSGPVKGGVRPVSVATAKIR